MRQTWCQSSLQKDDEKEFRANGYLQAREALWQACGRSWVSSPFGWGVMASTRAPP